MAKKRPVPELVKAGDSWYRLCVFLIHTKNEDGSPGLCKLVEDHKTIDIAGGEEFMTCYVPTIMLPNSKGPR